MAIDTAVLLNPACPAKAGKPVGITLTFAGSEYQIADENPSRKRILIQNRGPGAIYLSPSPGFTTNGGILLDTGGVFVDDPPFPHTGKWYAIAAVSGALIIVVEWS